MPLQVARAVHEASESEKPWDKVTDKKRDEKIQKAKAWLNTKAVEAMTPALLDERDPDSEIRGWFAEISQTLQSHLPQTARE